MKRAIKLKLKEMSVEYKPTSLIAVSQRSNIGSSQEAVQALCALIEKTSYATCENIYALFLTSTNKPIGYIHLGRGSIRKCTVNIRLLAQSALLSNAAKTILIHNHPSGTLAFSEDDFGATKITRDTLAMFDIELLDHIVVSSGNHLSMRDVIPKEKIKYYFGRKLTQERTVEKNEKEKKKKTNKRKVSMLLSISSILPPKFRTSPSTARHLDNNLVEGEATIPLLRSIQKHTDTLATTSKKSNENKTD